MREWLKVLRVDSGKSQQDVADAIGITKQYYQLIEAGKRQSSLSSLLIIDDNLPDTENIADVWENLPELSPPLIDGVLRMGHKMLLAGPSKAGKSFALIELCISIAEGKPWLGFKCASGRVLYADGSLKTTVKLSKTDEYKSAFANITVMGAKEISIKLASDAKVMLDSLSTFDNIEAENSALSGGAEAADDSGASAQKAVKLKKDSAFELDGVRGGKTIKMCYKSASDAVLEVTAGGVITQVNLGAAKEFTEVTLSVPVQAGENIVFKNTGSSTVTVDYINISGIAPAATDEDEAEEPGYSTAYIVGGIICSVVALAAAGVVLFVHLKRKKGSGAK